MKTVQEFAVFLKCFEELEDEAPRVALLNTGAPTPQSSLIYSVCAFHPPEADIFLVDSFPQVEWAFDNIYTFESKHFFELPKAGPKSIRYNVILDAYPDDNKSTAFVRCWDRIEEGGSLILSNVGDIDATLETLCNYTPKEVVRPQCLGSTNQGTISYQK